MRYEHAIEIPRSPAQVFAVLADVERTPEWFTRVQKVERIDDARVRFTILERPPTTRTLEGSIARTPDQHLAFRMEDPGRKFSVTIEFELSAIAAGTRLALRIDVEMRSLVGKLASPIIKRFLGQQVPIDLAKLRALV